MRIYQESPDNFSKAQEFYSSVNYHSPIEPQDLVISAQDKDEIIGVVRLTIEHSALILRGMMIAESHQRQGLGTQMLYALEKLMPSQDCFCLPHGWLNSFYGQIGFEKIEPDALPPHLKGRMADYLKRYPQLIAMRRPASASR